MTLAIKAGRAVRNLSEAQHDIKGVRRPTAHHYYIQLNNKKNTFKTTKTINFNRQQTPSNCDTSNFSISELVTVNKFGEMDDRILK